MVYFAAEFEAAAHRLWASQVVFQQAHKPGAKMPKGDGATFTAIVPPRNLWAQFQQVRMRHSRNLRCGPHITLLDPFVERSFLPESAEILRAALRTFPAFRVVAADFNCFSRKGGRDVVLFVEPKTDPPDALQKLADTMLASFPQCDDTFHKRGSGNKFQPHISLGKFNSLEKCMELISNLRTVWKPVEFLVSEIYLLARTGGDPFQLVEFVRLQGGNTVPAFGPSSLIDARTAATVVICGLDRGTAPSDWNATFCSWCVESGSPAPGATELLLESDGQPRTVALVEYNTGSEANLALSLMATKLPFAWYARPLHSMLYGDVIGGSCSIEI
eukprot:TRINITY_DN20088_c0_g1_i1.p1 TRINITY_DN20088_c0_g1~~TRINITY_DN20088_c0_g1_i1.p1  ORF type:complete len:340 (-),score=35.18 TRINITY_DN20088_c0_g1_i1:2-994(-)